jgi:D-serine deaminase-like pyridoxal phosphate-dependent protein
LGLQDLPARHPPLVSFRRTPGTARLFLELDTPALLIDVGIVEANLDRMAAALAGGPTRIRSHFKERTDAP